MQDAKNLKDGPTFSPPEKEPVPLGTRLYTAALSLSTASSLCYNTKICFSLKWHQRNQKKPVEQHLLSEDNAIKKGEVTKEASDLLADLSALCDFEKEQVQETLVNEFGENLAAEVLNKASDGECPLYDYKIDYSELSPEQWAGIDLRTVPPLGVTYVPAELVRLELLNLEQRANLGVSQWELLMTEARDINEYPEKQMIVYAIKRKYGLDELKIGRSARIIDPDILVVPPSDFEKNRKIGNLWIDLGQIRRFKEENKDLKISLTAKENQVLILNVQPKTETSPLSPRPSIDGGYLLLLRGEKSHRFEIDADSKGYQLQESSLTKREGRVYIHGVQLRDGSEEMLWIDPIESGFLEFQDTPGSFKYGRVLRSPDSVSITLNPNYPSSGEELKDVQVEGAGSSLHLIAGESFVVTHPTPETPYRQISYQYIKERSSNLGGFYMETSDGQIVNKDIDIKREIGSPQLIFLSNKKDPTKSTVLIQDRWGSVLELPSETYQSFTAEQQAALRDAIYDKENFNLVLSKVREQFEKYDQSKSLNDLKKLYLLTKRMPSNFRDKLGYLVDYFQAEFDKLGINVEGTAGKSPLAFVRFFYFSRNLPPKMLSVLKTINISNRSIEESLWWFPKSGDAVAPYFPGDKIYVPLECDYYLFYHEVAHLLTFKYGRSDNVSADRFWAQWNQFSPDISAYLSDEDDHNSKALGVKINSLKWADGSVAPLFGYMKPYGANKGSVLGIAYGEYEDIASFVENVANKDFESYHKLINPKSEYYQALLKKKEIIKDSGLKMTSKMAEEWAAIYRHKLEICRDFGFITEEDFEKATTL